MANDRGLAFLMTGLAATLTNPSLYRIVEGEKSLVLPASEAVSLGEALIAASQILNSLGGEEVEGLETSNKWLTGELKALAAE